MEAETLIRGVCLGCKRRRFDVRATQVGDELVELCPKCRREQGGAAEAVATLVPETEEEDASYHRGALDRRSSSLIQAAEPEICS